MIGIQHEVATRDELLAVVGNSGVRMITVTADLAEMPSFRLSPGQMLLGNGHRICFAPSQDGVQLTTDNEVAGLGLIADPRAVHSSMTPRCRDLAASCCAICT
jgi:hypothetical protein